ncbi:hypothetical protein CEXT_447011 [Caerostris extrusa]|uniref:Uncharacterized protein n=1 Tax=Caerostris extrusa TaxID=172846 RepID=A0AAV4X0K4_CAEEX|nr:hypothetical protein CEXT_447011 [Caerostris extrusa]
MQPTASPNSPKHQDYPKSQIINLTEYVKTSVSPSASEQPVAPNGPKHKSQPIRTKHQYHTMPPNVNIIKLSKT